MKTVLTPKGTELPLVNLKGKDYLQVAHRFVWVNEHVEANGLSLEIVTEIVKHTSEESIVRSVVTILDKDGKIVKKGSASKREDLKGFADHLEKAETGSIGRALAMIGFGTQFAQADLDEGERLADAPLVMVKSNKQVSETSEMPTRASFKTGVIETTKKQELPEGWS